MSARPTWPPKNPRLALLIGEARRRLDIGQAELADRVGVGQATASRYERGTNDMPLSHAVQICDILGIEPAALFEALRAR